MTAQTTKPKRTRKPKIDVSKALTLRVENQLSYAEIGKVLDCAPQTVLNNLKDLLPGPEIEEYRAKRSDIIAKAELDQLQIYFKMDEEERKSLINRRGFVDFGILYDKGRLEDGKSSGNYSILIDQIRQIKASET